MLISSLGLTYQPTTASTPPAPQAAANLTELTVAQQVTAPPLNNGSQNQQQSSGQGSSLLQDREGELRAKERIATNAAKTSGNTSTVGEQLSTADQQQVDELQSRDQQVKDHERAHSDAAGQYGGSPQYDYTRGPDGRLYATDGEVSVDTSPVPNNPQETIEKAQAIIKAARAPVDPSAQDDKIALEAQRMLAEAQAELARDKAKENQQAQQQAQQQLQDDTSTQARALEQIQERIEPLASQVVQGGGDASSAAGRGASDAQAAQSDTAQSTAANSETVPIPPTPVDDQLAKVQQQLREINRRLVELGVYSRLYPSGGFVNTQA